MAKGVIKEGKGEIMNSRTIEIIILEDAADLLRSLNQQAREKIIRNMNRVKKGERNNEIFKKLGDSEIWEFRAQSNGISYRLFSFWDARTNSLVVVTHGVVKKTQKTPIKELNKAKAIMNKYMELNYKSK